MNTYKHEVIVSVNPQGQTVAFTWLPDGYVEVGRHTIEGSFDPNKVAPELVKKLKEGLAESDAEHQKRRNAILDQIGKLEAIGFDVEHGDDVPF